MFRALLRSRLQAMFSSFGRNMRSKKKASPMKIVLIALLFIYIVGCFGLLFGMTFMNMQPAFHEIGLDWLYFVFVCIAGFALMFIGSIFMTYSQIFEAKDNELLLSMPIPPKYILLSRMVALYVYNLIFEAMVFVPAIVVYCMAVKADAGILVAFVLIFLFLPFLAIALSCVLGWLIAAINSRMRNKSLISMVISIAFLGAYFYFYSQMNSYIQTLILQAATIATKIKGAAIPLYLIGQGIAEPNFLYLAAAIGMFLVPFLIIYGILSAVFIRLVTTKRGFAKIKYKEKSLTVSGSSSALFQREWKHFLSSPAYMLNSSLGIILTVIGAVVLMVKKDAVIDYLSVSPELMAHKAELGLMLVAALIFVTSMNIITSSSVSLEGNRLWIVRSLPVDTKKVLMSKLKLHLVLTIPASLIVAIAFIFVFETDVTASVMMIVFPNIMNVLFAMLGLIMNLLLPKLEWISETAAVKQGASTIVTMLLAMFIVITPAIIYVVIFASMMSLLTYMLICLAVSILVCVWFYYYLTHGGCRRFERL